MVYMYIDDVWVEKSSLYHVVQREMIMLFFFLLFLFIYLFFLSLFNLYHYTEKYQDYRVPLYLFSEIRKKRDQDRLAGLKWRKNQIDY